MTDCKPCGPTGARFRYWCNKILPAVYDDSLSYYELMCKLTTHVNTVITEVNKDGEGIEELQERVKALEDLLKEFQEHGFDDYYMDQIEKWLNDNMWCIMSWASRIVWFGLSDDGYFTAYIPDNFSFLVFDVVQDPDHEDYGKLIMSYCQEVYEPCEISCWDADCAKPKVKIGKYETACNYTEPENSAAFLQGGDA